MKKLSNKQRKFLEYLRDEHKCLGYVATIPDMLDCGEYSGVIHAIVDKFKALRDSGTCESLYYKPTKYLK